MALIELQRMHFPPSIATLSTTSTRRQFGDFLLELSLAGTARRNASAPNAASPAA